MRRYRVWLAVVVAVLAVAALLAARGAVSPSSIAPGSTVAPTADRPAAPDFTGIDFWVNSGPLTVASLRGQVVLIDFWTYSCVNCTRTVPHLQALYARYHARGLQIVGVHSPEFDFEKDRGNVISAVQRLGITWPVALDSEMATWNAYGNNYWPAEYLLDQQGRIAYQHPGEGDYDQTEAAVVSLLRVPVVSGTPVGGVPAANTTPELYAGSARGNLDGEQYGAAGEVVTYPDTQPPDTDAILLTGAWADQVQYVQSAGAGGHIRLRFHAADVYIVAGNTAAPLTLQVSVDGAPVPAAMAGADLHDSAVTVSRHDLYHLLTGQPVATPQSIDITVPAGLQLYTFTFG